MARLAAVPQRRASFAETKSLAALSTPLVTTGVLAYRRPDHLEKLTTQPISEQLVADGDRLIITLESEPPRVIDLRSQPEIRALVDAIRGVLSGNLQLLKQYYGLRLSSGAAGWRLEMMPGGAAAKFLRAVAVDGNGTDVVAIETVQANGDSSRMVITP